MKSLVALKATWTEAEFATSWLAGAEMLLRTGTTTVLDIEAVPSLIPTIWEKTPLRVLSFREVITLKDSPEQLAAVDKGVRDWIAFDAHTRLGISPHAPYTTTTAVLQLAARLAREQCWPLTTHVAESEEEFEMFMYRNGPLYDWLKSQRDMSDCGNGSPVAYLERISYLKRNLLAAHVNYLSRDDSAILARRNVSVVHCPRSHEYFRHLRFPCAELQAAGVNLCLGTDSLATVRKGGNEPLELNMFSEMQAFAALRTDLPHSAILKMATVHAAQALGRKGHLGELTRGAAADIVALPFTGVFTTVYESVVQHQGDVMAAMIDGRWALQPALG